MLLFVKKKYADAIREGRKTFEIRHGSRYRYVMKGDVLSVNGNFSVEVLKVERRRLEALEELVNVKEIEELYPTAKLFYVFHIRVL